MDEDKKEALALRGLWKCEKCERINTVASLICECSIYESGLISPESLDAFTGRGGKI